MKIDLDDKTDVLTYHKKLLAEAQKEKEDLKAKVEKRHNSSKNLGKLLNTQMSANDKFGLAYGDHRYDDSEDEHVSQPTKEQEQPSFTSTNKQVKTLRETVKNQFTYSKNPTVDKKGLGYGFTARACFVCGSLSHLIRDCDFHEKRMAKQAELNNSIRKKSINTARASCTNNVSTARHHFNKQAVPTNAAMKVNTVKPIVNRVRPANVFYKTHSPLSRPFINTTALRTNSSYQKVNTVEVNAVSAVGGKRETADYPHRALKHKGIVNSGCSRHMTGNKVFLAKYQDFNGGPVAFGGSKGYITGKGKIKTGKLDFEDVCFVKELQQFNLFSVSQICDKKNKVLFTDSKCLILSPEFKLPGENQVLLRIPRQNSMYSFNLENIVPSGGLACLIANATIDESNKWHRRLGHVNFKNLNKLVKGNLVRGLPSKIFQNDHTCVACQKGKQHKASCRSQMEKNIFSERGISFARVLEVVPFEGPGDKIKLPNPCFNDLSSEGAFEKCPLHFQLLVADQDKSSKSDHGSTHVGVLEFSAEESVVWIPPHIWNNSYSKQDPMTPLIEVKYAWSAKGTCAKLQSEDLSFSYIPNHKAVLETTLHQHASLFENDVLTDKQCDDLC
ncbi:ribonuclease H-like domain-containing protein [Tanacetum coccineum]